MRELLQGRRWQLLPSVHQQTDPLQGEQLLPLVSICVVHLLGQAQPEGEDWCFDAQHAYVVSHGDQRVWVKAGCQW